MRDVRDIYESGWEIDGDSTTKEVSRRGHLDHSMLVDIDYKWDKRVVSQHVTVVEESNNPARATERVLW